LVLEGGRVFLAPSAEVVIDVESFQQLARQALASGEPSRCREVSVRFGDLLPAARYEDWVIAPGDRLREVQLRLLRQAESWEQVLALEPLDEVAHRELMRRYADAGNRLAARVQFEHLCELLSRDFGLEPDPETTALHRALTLESSSSPQPAAPPIRYVRTRDVSIAYQVVGAAGLDLLMIPGWISHLALDWEEPRWVSWCHRMTSFARLIRFDKRGTGLSDRPSGVPTLEERMEDARVVLDDLGLDAVHLMGWSEGGPLAIAFAAAYPERVQSLVLYGTQARFVRADDYPWAPTADEKLKEIEWTKEHWGAAGSALFYAPSGDARFAAQYEAYMRAGASPSAAAALLAVNAHLDVRPLLPRIEAPTLVVSRRDDPIGPPEPARAMSDLIPRARFVELEGVDHIIWAADTEPLCAEIEAFVAADHSAEDAGKVLGSRPS
jgi:pimeloyl-ACP methyl ester carboxylesterase